MSIPLWLQNKSISCGSSMVTLELLLPLPQELQNKQKMCILEGKIINQKLFMPSAHDNLMKAWYAKKITPSKNREGRKGGKRKTGSHSYPGDQSVWRGRETGKRPRQHWDYQNIQNIQVTHQSYGPNHNQLMWKLKLI